jgi:uncharacterized protein (DUF697 family)
VARLHPLAVAGLLRELRAAAADHRPLAVDGARTLADALARQLARGGSITDVRRGSADGALALVYVLAAQPTEGDRQALRTAYRARVPIVCVLAGPEVDPLRVPYALATDIVRVPAGSGFPLDEIATALAGLLGERATELAARLPALRRGVCEALVRRFARRAGVTGAAVFVPGADFPVLTLMQLRLVLRLAAAHGLEVDAQRLPEIGAVVGSGLAFRTLARQALGVVPVAGWAVKGAVAYTGTRALGEAALRYFESTATASTARA